MSFSLSPVLKQSLYDANGNPLVGGKVFSYQSGTTTPQATYTDATGATPNANPTILDANGQASIWLDQALSYKFIVKDASDAELYTTDGVIGILTNNAVATNALQDSAVTTVKIADSAVTTIKIAAGAVTTAKIPDGGVTMPKVGPFNDLTTDTAPDGAADFIPSYDTSATGNKKVLLSTVSGTTLLQTQTASASATIDFTTNINSTFDEYLFVISGVVPATDNTDFWIRVSENGGSSYIATASYAYNFVYSAGAAAPSSTGSSGSDSKAVVIGGLGNNTGEVFHTEVRLYTPASAKYKLMKWNGLMHGQTPSLVTFDGGCVYFGSVNAINAIRFMMSSGNITAGSFALYGVRKG